MSSIAENGVPSEASDKTRVLLAELWQRNRPVIEERLAVLDRAAASAEPMSEELHTRALDVAHKLSGSLGMFGFERGTVLARELQHMLEDPSPDTARLAEVARELRQMLLPPS